MGSDGEVADFSVRQLQAMANAVAVIFFPTPSSPVKSSAWGSGSVADEGLEQLDGVLLANDGVKSGCRRHCLWNSGRLNGCDTFVGHVPLPAVTGRQMVGSMSVY
jgi:hypothetical protein